jgi:hypothetical protein
MMISKPDNKYDHKSFPTPRGTGKEMPSNGNVREYLLCDLPGYNLPGAIYTSGQRLPVSSPSVMRSVLFAVNSAFQGSLAGLWRSGNEAR